MNARYRRLTQSLLALACLAAVSATPATAATQKTCSPPKYPGDGYFSSLKVTGTSCNTGKALAVAYYKCRLKHGRKGKCTSKVLNYSCTEKRNSIATEFVGKVTCKRGSRKIIHSYQQNT